MATYVVGDIQACLNGLHRLLKKVNFCAKHDKLVAVGDLIGRGPHALETLEYLMSLGDCFDCVLGNHDLHFLAIYANIRKAKPSDKFDALLASSNIEKCIDWLRQKPLALSLNKHIFVSHAGLYPLWSVNKGLKLSQEVSNVLQSDNWQMFLSKMYGSLPDQWHDSLAGYDRLRFIVNAFTRMRYLHDTLQLEFTCKTPPSKAPNHLTPWFNISNKHLNKKHHILFGHWAALQGKTATSQFIGLDTGYLWGQSMTALNIENMTKTSVKHQET